MAIQGCVALARRRDRTVTETSSVTITQTINETYTVHLTTEIYSTIYSTITIPTTINNTVTLSLSASASLARIAPELAVSASSARARLDTGPKGALATAAPPVSSTLTNTPTSKISTTTVLTIVLGSLALVGSLVAAAFYGRRMLRRYRQQRVMRKRVQTEGNEMPAVKCGSGAKVGIENRSGVERERSNPGQGQGQTVTTTEGTSSDMMKTGKEDEKWEEVPPAYSIKEI